MNKTLAALMTKLNWQLKELAAELHNIALSISTIDFHLIENKHQLCKAMEIPAYIVPEQEISRLNYIVRQQQSFDALQQKKSAYEDQLSLLKNKQLRLNTELKMLEQYQQKQQEIKEKELIDREQKSSDNWALINKTREKE